MSTDIYDMFRGQIGSALQEEGMFDRDEGFEGNYWESPNYKRTEEAMNRVLDGGEEADYGGGLAQEFRMFLGMIKSRAVSEVRQKIIEQSQESFDFMI
jgi:hypothetical protein